MATDFPIISLPEDSDSVQGTIDCHTDVENISDVEEEVDSVRVSLLPKTHARRKHHKNRARNKGPCKGATCLLVAEDEVGGLTDTEVVEFENDVSDDGVLPVAEEFAGIFEALKPKIVEISDDKDGKLHIRTMVKGVVARNAKDDSEDSENDGSSRNRLQVNANRDALTDVESLSSELEEVDSKSDQGDMEEALQQYDYGRSVDTKLDQVEKKPKACPVQRKARKPAHRKKCKPVESSTFLVVDAEEAEQLTDVEYLAENATGTGVSGSSSASEAGMDLTDAEDLAEQLPVVPSIGIFVTGEDDDVAAAPSSRGAKTDAQQPSLLSLPAEDEAPLTDVEDVDVDDVEVRRINTGATPRNGPSLSTPTRQVISIRVEEDGTQLVTNTTNVSPFLRVETAEEDGNTDSEYLGVSGDEDEQQRRFSVTPDIEMFQGSTVDVKDSDQQAPAASAGLLVPAATTEALTDCEDMDVSDPEDNETEDYQSQDPAIFEQYEASYSAVTDTGDFTLASQPEAFESSQGGDMI